MLLTILEQIICILTKISQFAAAKWMKTEVFDDLPVQIIFKSYYIYFILGVVNVLRATYLQILVNSQNIR